MIENAPEVVVSGITYPIYSMDFSWGGADKPSSINISYVNKEGNYSLPSLSTDNRVNIQVGSFFRFTGFPISYSSSNSTSGKLISVTYHDTSVILDKLFIGLKGVHGQSNESPTKYKLPTVYGTFSNSLILLGNYVDPCENITDDYVDPCNPCVEQTEYQSVSNSNIQKGIDCQAARYTSVMDVTYNFLDFINALKVRGISFYNTPTVKLNFYGRYTGTARSVLRSWCEDFGLTFLWYNDSVYFIDLKNGLTINDTSFYNTCALFDYSESKTIENTSSSGVILYFGADGKIETYPCSNEAYNTHKLSLLPITLKDLFWVNPPSGSTLDPYIRKYYTLPKTGENSIAPLQIACMLSKYSRTLRDLVLLYEYYEVNEIDSTLDGKNMPLLGMKIKEVWRVDSAVGGGNQGEMKTIFENNIPESVRSLAQSMGAGMCLIEFNPDWYDKFYEFEKSLADNFIGRFWLSYFSKGDQYSFSGPDSSPDYFDAGTPASLPFADFIPVSSRKFSTLLSNLINDSAQKNKDASHVGAVETTNPNSFAHSFLLMDRQAAWEPTPEYDDIRRLDQDLSQIHFYQDGSGLMKQEGQGDDGLKPNEFYCLIFDKPGTFDLIDKGEGDHPVEKERENMQVEIGSYSSSYGLRSSICRAYQIDITHVSLIPNIPNWNYNINFYLPPQSHDTFGTNYPGYSVIARKNGDNEINTIVEVEKEEVIFGNVPNPSNESTSFTINYKDISSILSDIIEEGGTVCRYNVEAIKTLINNYYINTSREKSVIGETRSYTIGGFPTRELAVTDGVSSLSIRLDSNSGFSTSISFSNLPPISKSENIQDKEFERNMIKRYIRKKLASSKDKIIV